MSLDWAWGYPDDETTLEWRRAMRFHRVPREKEERKATKRGEEEEKGKEGKPRGRKEGRRKKSDEKMQLEKESPGEERGGGGKKRGRRKKKEEEKRRGGRVAVVHEETTRWSAEPSSALRKPLVGNRKPEGFRGMLFHLVVLVALLTALVMAMWGTWQDRTTQRSHQTTRNARRRTLRRWRRKARRWCRALRGMAAGRRLLAGIWRVAANWTSVISAHHSENPRKKPTRARSRLIGGRRWKRARRKRRKQVRPTREQQAEKNWTAALQEAKERGRRDWENYGPRWGQARGEIRLLKGQRRHRGGQAATTLKAGARKRRRAMRSGLGCGCGCGQGPTDRPVVGKLARQRRGGGWLWPWLRLWLRPRPDRPVVGKLARLHE